MGQASRTTKLLLDLSDRSQGGANREKRAALEQTVKLLDAARTFYVAFLLPPPQNPTPRLAYSSDHHQQTRERPPPTDTLPTCAHSQRLQPPEHPNPPPHQNA